jgi:hypothetical protein
VFSNGIRGPLKHCADSLISWDEAKQVDGGTGGRQFLGKVTLPDFADFIVLLRLSGGGGQRKYKKKQENGMKINEMRYRFLYLYYI